MTARYLSGHILVAPPRIIDRRFNNSVIYLVSHTEAGAWGLMLNKSSNHDNHAVLARARIDVPDLLGKAYGGGPVNTTSIHFLHTAETLSMETVVGPYGGVCSSGDHSFLTELMVGHIPRKFRMFVGMCSWAPGQLEGELTGTPPWNPDHSWLTAPASEEIVFDYDGMDQWAAGVEYCAQHTVREWMI